MVDIVLDWVEDTGRVHKLALLFLLTGFVSIIVFQFVIDPQRQRIQAFQQTLQSLDHRLAGIDEQQHRLDRLKGETGGLQSQVESQKRLLGIHVPIEQLLTEIADTAQSVGVTLKSWKPEESVPVPETDLNRVTLRLYVEGRYHALARFLEALQTLPKTLIVRSMDYQVLEDSAENPENGIQASFELIGFQATAPARPGQRVSERVTS